MLFYKMRSFLFLYFVFFTLSCSTSKKTTASLTPEKINALHFIGEYDIPHNLDYNNTTVGGLSGIDYDATHNLYYLVSDDRSDINPTRFYTANIFLSEKGIDRVHFVDVINMLQPDGYVYPNKKQDALHVPDPEAIRYNPVTGQLVWSSEGERIVTVKDTILENPSVNVIATNGKYISSYTLPANLVMQAIEKGPRHNSVLEGITFADNYKTLFASVEEPIYEDGPRAEITGNTAYIRILKFNTTSKVNTAQYAYKLDPVAYPAIPSSAFKLNGVPDILSISNNKLLVIERSFSTGRLACTIKVFMADLNEASDISTIPSLKANTDFKSATKKLVLNMDDLGIYIDNIEGVTFGPLLPNGHKTLLFIADNNFSLLEKSQILLFEVLE